MVARQLHRTKVPQVNQSQNQHPEAPHGTSKTLDSNRSPSLSGVKNSLVNPLKNPLVLFDGACGFCAAGMARWKRLGAGKLDFAPSQSGAGEPYGFPAGEALGALRLVESDGEIRSGAAAVFRMMELCGNGAGRAAWELYKKFSIFAAVADWGYARVAERRATLSKFSCKIPLSQERQGKQGL